MSKLEAGRSLDALVAEKVMGWCQECFRLSERRIRGEVEDTGPLMSMGSEDDLLPDGNRMWYCVAHKRPLRHASTAPHYSTSIEAAWEVVEKLSADGWRFTLCGYDGCTGVTFERGDDNGPNWEGCDIGYNATGDEFVRGSLNTMPHNICRAALAALKACGVPLTNEEER